MQGILLVDPNPEFLDSFKTDSLVQQFPLHTALNGKAAQMLLAEKHPEISALFVNIDIAKGKCGPDVFSIIRFSRSIRPSIKVFVLHDGKQGDFAEGMKKLGVSGVLDKNVSYRMLVNLSGLNAIHFDEEQALNSAKNNTDKVGEEASANDLDFFPVRAADFMSGSKVLFELYVKIRADRYIKLLRAGDSFSRDRLENYLKKEVQYFYLRNESRAHYLDYCGKISKAVTEAKNLSPEIRSSQVMNYGEEVIKFLRVNGLSESHLTYAGTLVNHVQKAVNDLPIQNLDFMKSFLNNLATYEHGVSTTMIAGLISREIQIESEPAVHIVGVSAFLHDIGLLKIPENLRHEDTSRMTPAEQEIFYKHAEIGSELLGQIPRMHPSILQSVSQHHERRSKKRKSSGMKLMNRVGEIIGISDEFINLIQRSIKPAEDKAPIHPYTEIANNFHDFSPAVVDAFRKVFLSSKEPPALPKFE